MDGPNVTTFHAAVVVHMRGCTGLVQVSGCLVLADWARLYRHVPPPDVGNLLAQLLPRQYASESTKALGRSLKARVRRGGHLDKMHGETEALAHVQRLRLHSDPPLDGQFNLQRQPPPGQFFVKCMDEASADAQVVNRHGYGEEAEAPVIKRTADTYKPPPRGRRNGVSGWVWHRSAAKCGRNAVYRRGA